MSKQFGLILSNKSKLTPANEIKKPSIFDDESDSDKEVEKPTGLKMTIKRQDRVAQVKAVEEDPTVYQYDEIYDDMDKRRKESKLSRKDLDKKPKYINKLLAAADKRKRENERRIERQVQKEREEEGDEFKDKDAFVTSAYRKKLEELKQLEEEEKREDYLEAIGDVKKQGNLDGFYRHLYDQKVNYEEDEIKTEITPVEDDKSTENPNPEHSEDKVSVKAKAKRKYRQRDNSNEEIDETDEKKLEHLPSNLDADSDFSIDSETDDSDGESSPKKQKTQKDEAVEVKVEKEAENKDGEDEKVAVKVEKEEVEKIDEVKEIKPKIDIWKKRTVGVVFDEALQRYYERKALREAAK